MNNHNEVCLICRSSNVITDSGSGLRMLFFEILCSKCGMVISDKIQENREESRTFFNTKQAKDRRRTGMPTSLAGPDMGFSTLSQEVIMMLVDMKLNHR
jgi:transcription initiation factor TFIIB